MRYEVRQQTFGVSEVRHVIWDTVLNKMCYRMQSGVSQPMTFGLRKRAELACTAMNRTPVR